MESALRKTGFWTSTVGGGFDLLDWASGLGLTPRPASTGGPLVSTLTPTPTAEAKPRSLSRKHGLGAFPPHTDAAHHRIPPRMTALRLVSGSRPNRPTLLFDWSGVADEALRSDLRYGVWLVRAGRHRFYRPAIEVLSDGRTLIRYDQGCMTPATPRAERAVSLIDEYSNRASQTLIEWREGSLLVIDNWRVLHARAPNAVSTSDSNGEESWSLERVLLDLSEGASL